MENKPQFHPELKLMEQVCEVLCYHHYAYRTEQTYCQWILRYIHFFGDKIHPRDLGAGDVERFLSDLTVKQKVAASTQRQALNVIVFLYRVSKTSKSSVSDILLKGNPQVGNISHYLQDHRFPLLHPGDSDLLVLVKVG